MAERFKSDPPELLNPSGGFVSHGGGVLKVREILEKINLTAPFALAEEWDNSGLMVGDPEGEVRRLALTLDPLPEALEEARRGGCQALLSHHPLFFHPVRKIDFSVTEGKVVQMAALAGMAVLSAHTNWDSAEEGVSRVLAEKMKLVSVAPLQPSSRGTGGMGAVGNLPAAAPVTEVLERLKSAWNLSRLDYYGPTDCSILRTALCGGSGGSLWPAALSVKADLYVTADMKYHDIVDCVRARLPVAVIDHGEMESGTLAELARYLSVPGELEVVLLNYRALAAPLRL
ncbi:MAG: Nif3-like dinuclear metal center hexameric protein [Synergistaceae bacterium]|nr:Nif3-like dinuclear metal center hexameric protein [Synergistaceae bacterium]